MIKIEPSKKKIKNLYKVIDSIKPYIRKIFPRRIWFVLRRSLFVRKIYTRIEKKIVQEWLDARTLAPWIPDSNELDSGVNLIGYFRTVKGISEAARGSVLALERARIPYTINDYEFGIPVWQQVESLPDVQHGDGFKFNTNLIHVNPPQIPFLWNSFKRDNLTARYNIGVWYWELPIFPDEWFYSFAIVDEIWAATQFIFDSISAKSTVPVVKIPPCVHPVYDRRLNRSDFNLPADRFLFMCAYDILSFQDRKNPLGAVDAFTRAFPKNDSSVGLVIKVNNATENPQEMRQLQTYVKGYSNCYIIDDVFDKLRFNSLLNVIDAFVSLHRSEGFGLIPAEAMSLGKPVIMTRWSGNVDYMTLDNSCGVDFKLIPVSKYAGFDTRGQFWAEPNIEHAVNFMQKIYSDREYYLLKSRNAKKYIIDHYSPDKVGQLMKSRLQKIGLIE